VVRTFDVREQPLLYLSLVDFLQIDPSIDLEQRAPAGVQADDSLRGSTFEQTLIMVNGRRLNDAQTGHHNLDVPLPEESVDRIEVLHGAGSTMYGADAVLRRSRSPLAMISTILGRLVNYGEAVGVIVDGQ